MTITSFSKAKKGISHFFEIAWIAIFEDPIRSIFRERQVGVWD